MNVTVRSVYDARTGVLTTELHGDVGVIEVEIWKRTLQQAASSIPPGSTFKLLLDLRGYEPNGIDAHRAMREVVPLFLAEHGLETAYVDLFEGARIDVEPAPRTRCIAFANVHHDAGKMANYERKIARANQRFFTDRAEAERWLSMVNPEQSRSARDEAPAADVTFGSWSG